MSRRIVAFLLVLVVGVGMIAVAPAGAARGGHSGGGVKTSIQEVDGTFEGWVEGTVPCAGGVWIEAQHAVRASGLGRGTLYFSSSLEGWEETWVFTTRNGDQLTGTVYVQYIDTTPGMVAEITQAIITGGTGKFEGVSAGDITTWVEVVAGGGASPSPCDTPVLHVVQGTISGLLMYGEPTS